MMSTTTPLELELELDYTSNSKTSASKSSYSFLKTELSLSLPGSDDSNPALGLSLFDQPNPKEYSFINLKSNSNKGERGFVSTDGKWAYYGGSECELGRGGAALFSHGAGELKDMDIDVAASASQKSALDNKPVNATASAAKAQVVGWPPIRSFRKNSVASASTKNSHEADVKLGVSCLYVKVSMDGAPYLRKVDLKLYKNYKELSSALKKMFTSFHVGKDGILEFHLNDKPQGFDCVLTYEDKDGDWMLVGDVPWNMFTSTCKRLRIMKGSEAIGLAAPGGMEN